MKKLIVILTICLLAVSCGTSQYRFVMTNESMLPTLPIGTLVKITKDINHIDYGDLVVFDFEGTGYIECIKGPFVFRVMGLPGDSIAVEKGIPIINGVKNKTVLIGEATEYHNEYLIQTPNEREEKAPNGKTFRTYTMPEYMPKTDGDSTAIFIPQGYYYLMADNRINAYDSRYIGCISKDKILGKVIKITEGAYEYVEE